MSGLVGIVVARADRRPEPAVLDRMAERLVHRGPDDHGAVARGPAALGIRRLRTVDLTPGSQPVTGEDGRIWAVLDGEVANHRELANRLAASGHTIRTRSDAETVVHAWEVRGRDALDELEGAFAVAVWQEASRTLVLARDRLGVKPLYYATLPDQLVFASELDAVLAHPGVSRELDVDALAAYCLHGFVPAPASMVRAVRKLPPGHRLVYADGEAKVEPWWELRYDGGPRDEIVGLAHLAAALDIAVRQQLRADVPVGVLLSGGLDSAALVAIARSYAPARLETFTLGFAGAPDDETAAARAVAEALGTDHHEHRAGDAEALAVLEGLGARLDEPLADAGLVPTALLARLAGRSVGVALSGLGADEVFAGHTLYRSHRLAGLRARLPLGAAPRDPVLRHARWLAPWAPEALPGLLSRDAWARLSAPPSFEASRRYADEVPGAPWLHRVLHVDLRSRLADGALQALDRGATAGALGVRTPLLDRRVVEVAAPLPPRAKLRGGRTKHILRRALRGRVPAAVLTRPARPLAAPLARWFRGPLGARLRDLATGALVRPDAVERLIAAHAAGRADHARALYALLVLLAWARHHRAT